MEFVIGVLAIFLNFWLLYWKITNQRHADAVVDITMMVVLVILFGGTASGMATAMGGGALISIGLLIFPPDLNRIFGGTEDTTKSKPTNPYPDWYYN